MTAAVAITTAGVQNESPLAWRLHEKARKIEAGIVSDAKGSFPVYLNIQAKEIDKALPYIPRDRLILTVSNHAHRAGAAGDLLASKGFKVAGAAGSEDYEAQGGRAIVRVTPPPKAASSPAVQ